MNVRQSFIVYELIDPDGTVVYVGSTTNVHQRLLDHRRKDWWRSVDHARIHVCVNRADMVSFEASLISEHCPVRNTYGNPQACRRPARSVA